VIIGASLRALQCSLTLGTMGCRGYRERCMPGRGPSSFTCPSCKALYELVKVAAGPETVFRDVSCRVCDRALAGREGDFVLKYFLLRKGRTFKNRGAHSKPQPTSAFGRAHSDDCKRDRAETSAIAAECRCDSMTAICWNEKPRSGGSDRG
jgi:hypothetical protein